MTSAPRGDLFPRHLRSLEAKRRALLHKRGASMMKVSVPEFGNSSCLKIYRFAHGGVAKAAREEKIYLPSGRRNSGQQSHASNNTPMGSGVAPQKEVQHSQPSKCSRYSFGLLRISSRRRQASCSRELRQGYRSHLIESGQKDNH